MKTRHHLMMFLIALLVVAGCASTKVSNQEELVTEKVPRPANIWVHDFAAMPEDVPDDSALAEHHSEHSTPQTAEQIATGQKLGAEIAAQLVERIRGMGMPAERATSETKPRINDIVIRGYLVSVVEGTDKKRIVIGFGSGASELRVAAEGFQMTSQGLRKLGSGSTDATGSKTPGAAMGVVGLVAMHNPVGLIVSTGMKVHDEKTGSSTIEGRAKQTANEIADVLKQRFQEQDWID